LLENDNFYVTYVNSTKYFNHDLRKFAKFAFVVNVARHGRANFLNNAGGGGIEGRRLDLGREKIML
jgi:hypothetical protein